MLRQPQYDFLKRDKPINCLFFFKCLALKKQIAFFKLHILLPGDDEGELLSAGFDPVLSLHVRHELCAVTIDSQDDVPWTKVTLSGFAARCDLQVAFIHTQSIHSQGGKEKKKKTCYRDCHSAIHPSFCEEREKVEERKSIRSRTNCLIDAALLLGSRHSSFSRAHKDSWK